MNRYSINLASKPFRNNALLWAGLGICTAALVVFSWWNVHVFRAADESLTRWSDALAKRQVAMDSLAAEVASMNAAVGRFDLDRLGERSEFANAIIMSRLLSWSTLFDRLEGVQPENVRLRSISPIITKKGIELGMSGVSKDHESLLRFEEALLDSEFFNLVYPLQETSDKDHNEIHFNLLFGYQPLEFEQAMTDTGTEDVIDLSDIPELPEEDELEPGAAEGGPASEPGGIDGNEPVAGGESGAAGELPPSDPGEDSP